MHAKEKSFNVLCGVCDCREVFRTFSAFNSHIYRHHRAEVGIDQGVHDLASQTPVVSLPASDLSPSTSDCCNDPSADMYSESPTNDDSTVPFADVQDECMDDCSMNAFTECHTALTDALTMPDDQTLAAAKMILSLREGHQVSQVALTEVISGCRLLCNRALNQLKIDVVNSSDNSAIDLGDYNPFKSIDTNYLFEKYCVEHLGCLVSE